MGGGKGVGGETKSYDNEKAWPSINHSILSAESKRLFRLQDSDTSLFCAEPANYPEELMVALVQEIAPTVDMLIPSLPIGLRLKIIFLKFGGIMHFFNSH